MKSINILLINLIKIKLILYINNSTHFFIKFFFVIYCEILAVLQTIIIAYKVCTLFRGTFIMQPWMYNIENFMETGLRQIAYKYFLGKLSNILIKKI